MREAVGSIQSLGKALDRKMEHQHTILIVDDDPRICRLLQRYLEQAGYRTYTATSGKEMRRTLAELKIDLVMIDGRLQDDEASTRLGSMPDLGVVTVTHKPDARAWALGQEINAGGLVTKPFNERELLTRIRTTIRRQSKMK